MPSWKWSWGLTRHSTCLDLGLGASICTPNTFLFFINSHVCWWWCCCCYDRPSRVRQGTSRSQAEVWSGLLVYYMGNFFVLWGCSRSIVFYCCTGFLLGHSWGCGTRLKDSFSTTPGDERWARLNLHPVSMAIPGSGWFGNRKGTLLLRKRPLGEPPLQPNLFSLFP